MSRRNAHNLSRMDILWLYKTAMVTPRPVAQHPIRLVRDLIHEAWEPGFRVRAAAVAVIALTSVYAHNNRFTQTICH